MVRVCVPSAPYVFACVVVSGHRQGVCARGMGRRAAGHLDAEEDDLDDREDEFQLRLAVDVADVIAHPEDVEADGAAAEEHQGAWPGQVAVGTPPAPGSPSPPLSVHPVPPHSPRTQMGPA